MLIPYGSASMFALLCLAPRRGLSTVPVSTRLRRLVYSSFPRFPCCTRILAQFSHQCRRSPTHYSAYRYKQMIVPPLERLQGDAIPKLRQNIDYNTVGHSLLLLKPTRWTRNCAVAMSHTLVRATSTYKLRTRAQKFSAWEDTIH